MSDTEHVRPYAGPRKCLYGPEPATWDVAGFLSCGDVQHLGRASDDWVDRQRQQAIEDIGRVSRIAGES